MIKRTRVSRTRLISGAALLTGVLCAAAQVGYGATLTGDATETAVSGFKGSSFTVGDANSATHSLYGISSKERSDNPCVVSIKTEHINDSSKQTSSAKNLCGSKGATSSELYVDYGNSDDTGSRTFVTGIQVCMNNDKSRVKGFRLRGRQVSDSSTLVEMRSGGEAGGCSPVFHQGGMDYRLCGIITEPKDVRTNADEKNGWMKWAECPDGKVATAAVLHFDAGNEPRSLTSIALKCRTVAP